ncbi:putative tight junction protein ZO-1 [Triplophysa rosa]|uniref:Tight junction protein ZO-1 n=1 Tax=Triplophysa rosa TaxID=992332 RepID=A0A9W7X5S4_TRIRA|nr:putative tight junction protein ZO-1 [Triplophysa rosa]
MKYQKYITVMQMAMGVTASNKDDCIPPKRQLWVPPCSDAPAASVAAPPAATVSQGKPSLRRIKGRIHKSKSLDSIDLLDGNVSQYTTRRDDVIQHSPVCLLS